MNNTNYKELFVEYLKGCSLSKSTISRMRIAVSHLYRFLNRTDIRDVKESNIVDFIEYLKDIKGVNDKNLSSLTVENYL